MDKTSWEKQTRKNTNPAQEEVPNAAPLWTRHNPIVKLSEIYDQIIGVTVSKMIQPFKKDFVLDWHKQRPSGYTDHETNSFYEGPSENPPESLTEERH